jgi:hypothetical protein
MQILKNDLENQTCEAIDCNAKAVKKIEVNAGMYGKIPLFLCYNCVPKFNEVK